MVQIVKTDRKERIIIMKKVTILKPEDVVGYIADAFCVTKNKVHVRCFMESRGYGLCEHDEPTFQIEVVEEKEDEKK